jgi:hypothetical protein
MNNHQGHIITLGAALAATENQAGLEKCKDLDLDININEYLAEMIVHLRFACS